MIARATERAPSLLLPCIVAGAQSMTFTNHAPLIPLIVRDLHITPAQAGFLSTAMFVVGGVASLGIGNLSDRVGPKPVLTATMACLALATVGIGLAPTYAVMLVMKMLAGFSLTGVFVAGGHYVAAHWRGPRQYMVQGAYGGMIQLGAGVSIFTMPLAAAHVGWRGALVLSAVPVILTLVWWHAAAVPPDTPPVRQRMRVVLGDHRIWRLGFAHTSMFGVSIVVGTWIAVYFVHEFGFRLGAAGVLGSARLVLGFLGRPAGGLLVTALGLSPRGLIVGTLAANTLGLLLMAAPGRPLALAVSGMVLVGLGSSVGYAAIMATTSRARPDAAGAALGVVGMVSTFAVIVFAPVVGELYSRTGDFTVPFLVLALLPVAALLAALPLPRGALL
jgi:NNP family nitrate/nitrite transporter-like MFS transporter